MAERRLELLYIRVEGNDQVKTPRDVGRIHLPLTGTLPQINSYRIHQDQRNSTPPDNIRTLIDRVVDPDAYPDPSGSASICVDDSGFNRAVQILTLIGMKGLRS